MSVLSLVLDSLGLVVGSLLAAGVLTFAGWWLGDTIHRPWVAFVGLLAIYGGMLASPLDQSLFARMAAVFGLVGIALLYFIGRADADEGRGETPH